MLWPGSDGTKVPPQRQESRIPVHFWGCWGQVACCALGRGHAGSATVSVIDRQVGWRRADDVSGIG